MFLYLLYTEHQNPHSTSEVRMSLGCEDIFAGSQLESSEVSKLDFKAGVGFGYRLGLKVRGLVGMARVRGWVKRCVYKGSHKERNIRMHLYFR